MTKKKIASLLTLWLAGSGIASAAQPEIQSDRMQAEVDTYELPAVTVTGTRALADTDGSFCRADFRRRRHISDSSATGT